MKKPGLFHPRFIRKTPPGRQFLTEKCLGLVHSLGHMICWEGEIMELGIGFSDTQFDFLLELPAYYLPSRLQLLLFHLQVVIQNSFVRSKDW